MTPPSSPVDPPGSRRDRRGILGSVVGAPFRLHRYPPGPALEGLIDWFWVASWQVPPGATHTQELLPHPCANLYVSPAEAEREGAPPGPVRAELAGVVLHRGSRRLTGAGVCVAAKTTVGGLGAFLDRPAGEYNDRVVALGEAVGTDDQRLIAEVLAAGATAEAAAAGTTAAGTTAAGTTAAGTTAAGTTAAGTTAAGTTAAGTTAAGTTAAGTTAAGDTAAGDGATAADREAADRAAAGVAVLAAALEGVLRPARVAAAREVAAVARIVEADRQLRRVEQLAALAGVGVRTLQRMFAEYAGVSPARVLRRYRLLEATEAARRGESVVWAQLAVDLGYSDQSHLVRDFTAMVGSPPAAYARLYD